MENRKKHKEKIWIPTYELWNVWVIKCRLFICQSTHYLLYFYLFLLCFFGLKIYHNFWEQLEVSLSEVQAHLESISLPFSIRISLFLLQLSRPCTETPQACKSHCSLSKCFPFKASSITFFRSKFIDNNQEAFTSLSF